MDPVSLVTGALAAGLSETVSEAVQDAYRGLRDALIRRLRRDGDETASEEVVQALEERADDVPALRAAVSEASVADDEEVVAAAARLLRAADPAGARVGKYVIDLRGAKGVQVGDNPSMTINF
jgi:hypothetical protein